MLGRSISMKLDLDSGDFNRDLGIANSELDDLVRNAQPVIRDLPRGISSTADSIDQMARATGLSSTEMRRLAAESSDVVKQNLDKEFRDAARAAGMLDSEIDQVANSMNRAEKETNTWKNSMKGVVGFVAGLGLSAMLGAGVMDAMELSRQYQKTAITMKQLLGGNAELGQQAMDTLQSLADVTPFVDSEVMGVGKQLLGLGVPLDQLEEKIKRLGDISAGSGKDLSELTTIYGQVMMKGKLQGDELLQMAESGIPIVKALATQFGVAEKKQIFDMASKGVISFQDMDEALEGLRSGTGIYAGMMDELSQSWSGRLSTLSSYIDQFKRSMGDFINTALDPILAFFTDAEAGATRVKIAMTLFSIVAVSALGAVAVAGWTAIAPFLPMMAAIAGIGAAVTALYLIFQDFYIFIRHGAEDSDTLFEGWLEGLFGSADAAEEFRQVVLTIWDALAWAGSQVWELAKAFWPVIKWVGIIWGIVMAVAILFATWPYLLAIALVVMAAYIYNHWDDITEYMSEKWSEFWAWAMGLVEGVVDDAQEWWDDMDIIGGIRRQFEDLKSLAGSIWRDIVNDVSRRLEGLINFDDLTEDFIWAVNKAIDGINSVLELIPKAEPIPHIEARAMGGPIRSGQNYLVGERGPELITASRDGYVVPNHQLAGGGGGNNFTLNIDSIVLGGGATRLDADNLIARIRQAVDEILERKLYAASAQMGFSI